LSEAKAKTDWPFARERAKAVAPKPLGEGGPASALRLRTLPNFFRRKVNYGDPCESTNNRDV